MQKLPSAVQCTGHLLVHLKWPDSAPYSAPVIPSVKRAMFNSISVYRGTETKGHELGDR